MRRRRINSRRRIRKREGHNCDDDKDNHDVTVMMFSAKDQDHDHRPGFHCARHFEGGWWYKTCYFFCPIGAVPEYRGFIQFGLCASPYIQKTRFMIKIAD